MSARNPPRPGWVTIAMAAAALTDAGDKIDASNVSRYLARNDDIPQERAGKYRFVDLKALMRHRNTSLFVADKRQAREDDASVLPVPPSAADEEAAAAAPAGSPLAQANAELKQIELRRKRREEEVEVGSLIPADEVQMLCAGMMEAFAAELARQEAQLTSRHGREIGIDIRKAHRAARAAASARLIEAATKSMPSHVVAQLQGAAGPVAVAA
jgi:hypothetical protein